MRTPECWSVWPLRIQQPLRQSGFDIMEVDLLNRRWSWYFTFVLKPIYWQDSSATAISALPLLICDNGEGRHLSCSVTGSDGMPERNKGDNVESWWIWDAMPQEQFTADGSWWRVALESLDLSCWGKSVEMERILWEVVSPSKDGTEI